MKSLYFSHDYSASDDVKILFLRQQLGMEGVGIYWYIVERLAQAGGRLPVKIIPVLAMQMQTPDVKVSAVINQFDLFSVEKDLFFSQRLISFIDKYAATKLLKSQGGKKGMEARWKGDNKPEDKNSFI